MLKKIIVGALVMAWAAGYGSAQSNEQLDALLAQAQARLDTAAYLLLAAAGTVPEESTPEQAFAAAVEKGFLSKTRVPGDPVTVEDLAFLVMKTQALPGGLEWMFLPSPRAAYRELSFRKIINTSAGPQRIVAGDEVVRTLSGAVALKGGSQ